jgi:CheY-like chemotaxis protein
MAASANYIRNIRAPLAPALLEAALLELIIGAMQLVLAQDVVDLVVLDLKLQAEDGMALARRLRDDSAIPTSCSPVAAKKPTGCWGWNWAPTTI